MSTKNGFKWLFKDTYEEGGPSADVADRISAAYPQVMSVEFKKRLTAKIAEDDKYVFLAALALQITSFCFSVSLGSISDAEA